MNILIIHHNERPSRIQSGIQTGEGIRCEQLGQGLEAHGFTVQYLCRSNWENKWSQVIHSTLQDNPVDAIIISQVDDIHRLPPLDCLVILDLYAPRLLELAFEPDHGQSISLLAALGKADLFLCSHARQKWHWWGVLSLAGIDLRTDPICIVPLAIETIDEPKRDEQTIFVGGGLIWPWQSPHTNLEQALEYLLEEDIGRVFWFLPPGQTEEEFPLRHSLLSCIPWKNREEYRAVLQRATFALDLSPNSPERELSFGFRQMEYFGCHLPILSTNENALAASYPSGCLVDPDVTNLLNFSLDRVWQEKAQQELKEAQRSFAVETTVEKLVIWLHSPLKRDTPCSSLLAQSKLYQEEHQILQKQEQLEQKLRYHQQEIQQKNELISSLNAQIQDHSSSVHRLSRAIDEVAAFKQETARVMAENIHQKEHLILQLQEENSTLRADIAKKTAELHAMDKLRSRLENDLHHVRLEKARFETENKKRWRR